jgi:predicted nucleic acid-binding Zn ribbon protein
MDNTIGYCEICNKPFVKYRRFHKLCSDKCRFIFYEKQPYYKKKKIVAKNCIFCNKEFKTNDNKKKYCSEQCYIDNQSKYHRRKEPIKKICIKCNISFTTRHAAKKYCSLDCYKEAKRAREKRNVSKYAK